MARYYIYARELAQFSAKNGYTLNIHHPFEMPDMREVVLDLYIEGEEMRIRYGKDMLLETDYHGKITWGDVANMQKALKEYSPHYYNRCLMNLEPEKSLTFESPELGKQISDILGITPSEMSFHISMLKDVESLMLTSNEELADFASCAQVFTGLKELNVNVNSRYMQPPAVPLLVVPENVKNINITNSLLQAIDISHTELNALSLTANQLMTGIYGLDLQTDMYHINVDGLRYTEIEYRDLRSNNPEAEILLNEEDVAVWLQKGNVLDDIIRGGKYIDNTQIYENNSYSLVTYKDPQMWVAMNDRANKLLDEIAPSSMTRPEKVLAVHKYCTEEVKYPEGKNIKYQESHSMADVLFHKNGVCEAKCKAMHFLLAKLGIESELVYCQLDTKGPEYLMAGSQVPQPKYLTQFRTKSGEKIGDDPNHAIIRVRFGQDWMYFDPTNDYNLDWTKADKDIAPCAFRSKLDIAATAIEGKDSDGQAFLEYILSPVEKETLSRYSLDRHALSAMLRTVEEKQHDHQMEKEEKKPSIWHQIFRPEIAEVEYQAPFSYMKVIESAEDCLPSRPEKTIPDITRDFTYSMPNSMLFKRQEEMYQAADIPLNTNTPDEKFADLPGRDEIIVPERNEERGDVRE